MAQMRVECGEVAGNLGRDAEVLVPVELDVTPMPVKGTEVSGWIAGRAGSAS